MSSNLLHNLSYSKNLSKTTIHCEELMTAVNKTLTKYCNETDYEDYVSYYNLHKNLFSAEKCSGEMLTEKIILCEINASLWVKALKSAISNITNKTYPHYIIVQNIINYLLNNSSNENFGTVEEFFYKLLISHPPKPEMWNYYWQIMSDHFVVFSDKKTEDEPLIFCLIEEITNCLKIIINCIGSNQLNMIASDSEFSSSNKMHSNNSELGSLEIVESSNIILNRSAEITVTKKQNYFIDLSSSEKIKRCCSVLNFVYNILETDFTFWLQSKELKPSFTVTRPLISSILWQNVRDIGLLNKEVHKILDLYGLVKSSNLNFQITHVIQKLVTLLGEVIRCSDNVEEIKYPFLGKKSDNFFRELAVILYQCVVENKKNLKENELIVHFKPPWLRLGLCSHLLSLITGYQCLPELTEVYDILEHIAHTESGSQNCKKITEKPENSMNLGMMKKLKKFKSINTKLKNGKTLLHVACEENDIEKIKALLTFPELDVNAVDRDGWTALHIAAHLGNATSIQELLSFCPKSGAQKSVNTRARGPESITPLMCAVVQGHMNICQLLLQHSGSVLLEDVNELNQTPLELSNVAEVTNILQHYKKNKVWTLHSHKDINFDLNLKNIVLRLCVEMTQAYFCTYRTWDVYKTLKRSEKNSTKTLTASDVGLKWDYLRYQRDIKRNIYKLRRLIPKLELIEEFKELSDVYVRILSFNKTC